MRLEFRRVISNNGKSYRHLVVQPSHKQHTIRSGAVIILGNMKPVDTCVGRFNCKTHAQAKPNGTDVRGSGYRTNDLASVPAYNREQLLIESASYAAAPILGMHSNKMHVSLFRKRV